MPGNGPRRRTIIAMIPVATVLAASGCTSSPPKRPKGDRVLLFFDQHQAAVVEDATARIAPGPGDDPAEAGHPGAREADVTGYIDDTHRAWGFGFLLLSVPDAPPNVEGGQSGDKSAAFSANASPIRSPIPACKAKRTTARPFALDSISLSSPSVTVGLCCSSFLTMGISMKSWFHLCGWISSPSESTADATTIFTTLV